MADERTTSIQVPVNETEKATIEGLAREAGYDTPDYVRLMALTQMPEGLKIRLKIKGGGR